jgi:DNA-binding CsgD family transcriptional regulator
MERLSASDVSAVLGFVGDTYTTPPGSGFRLHTIARLRSLVSADMTAWVETRAGRPEVEVVASPCDPLPDGPRRFARVRDEHPVLSHFERSRYGGARKLSDFFDRTRYRRLPIYQEFFRPAGVEHQISIALPSAGRRLIRITLNRGPRDFSERDRRVLDLVRPHVAQAYQTAAEIERLGSERHDLERVAEAAEVGVVVIGEEGRLVYANRLAEKQLVACFGARALFRRRLPDAVAGWLGGRGDRPPGAAPWQSGPLVVERDGGRLEIRALADARRRVLLLRERTTRLTPRSLEALGLTRRQAEVLGWLAQGKANAEIAGILAISPNTVARHVEAIFERLGVATRTAAAAAAFTHLPRADQSRI